MSMMKQKRQVNMTSSQIHNMGSSVHLALSAAADKAMCNLWM